MLSHLELSSTKFILIIDELSQEKFAEAITFKLFRNVEFKSEIKRLKLSSALKEASKFDDFVNECSESDKYRHWIVLMPPLSDLCSYQRPSVLFQFINDLKKCPFVNRCFLWASTHHLAEDERRFLLAYFKYMSDIVVHLQSSTELAIVSRKPGGGMVIKSCTYKRTKNEFLLEASSKTALNNVPKMSKAQAGPAADTFKIELEEEELVARNALTLPYEKTTDEKTHSDIIYTPDAEDDFDDDDPDEDLCI